MNSLFRLIMAIIIVVIGLGILGGALFVLGSFGLLVGLFVVGLLAGAYEFIGSVKYVGKNNDKIISDKKFCRRFFCVII